jgi:HSP20 family protein
MAERKRMAEQTVPQPQPQTQPAGEAGAGREHTRAAESYVPPPVDIFEDEQGLVVLADLPGVTPDGLDVSVERGILTIQARAGHLAPGHPLHREYELRGFYRQFQLSDEVDTAKISAELKHGVLTLRLPRVQRAQPQRIQVKLSE